MRNIEIGSVLRVLGGGLVAGVGVVSLAGCAPGAPQPSANEKPSIEAGLQEAIQTTLRGIGARVLTLARKEPYDICSTLPYGAQAIAVSCANTENVDRTLNFGRLEVVMNAVHGQPDPNSTFYANVGFGTGSSSRAVSGGFELVAPEGDSLAQGNLSGWAANSFDSPYDKKIGKGYWLDTQDPSTWVHHGGRSKPTDVITTAEAIVEDVQNDMNSALSVLPDPRSVSLT